MNVLDATRKWLRDECPYIDKKNRFNANYLGAETTEYTVRSASESHAEDVCGFDKAEHSLVFEARLPYGKDIAANIGAADFFANLSAWVRVQNRAHIYPKEITGYTVTKLTASNAGLVVQADANTARYQLQLKLILEED